METQTHTGTCYDHREQRWCDRTISLREDGWRNDSGLDKVLLASLSIARQGGESPQRGLLLIYLLLPCLTWTYDGE